MVDLVLAIFVLGLTAGLLLLCNCVLDLYSRVKKLEKLNTRLEAVEDKVKPQAIEWKTQSLDRTAAKTKVEVRSYGKERT